VTERNELLESIANTTADYRACELPAPTPEHVDRWVRQFDVEVQVPLLRELDHVLKHTYFSRKHVENFLSSLVSNVELAGTDPCRYWRSANFLDIQKDGHSQKDMLAMFSEILKKKCGFEISACGSEGGHFIYLDDVVFSGSRVKNDLAPWIQEEAPNAAIVHVIAFCMHTGSEWAFREPISNAIKASGKNICIRLWQEIELENRKANRDVSEVLWPTTIPDYADVKAYVESQANYPFVPRNPGGHTAHPIFSSEEGRQVLETHLLAAGVRIRGFCKDPKPILKPLGFSPFGLGFGSTIVTYRNCPNNAPLAFWWGDPDGSPGHPFSKWYPLFPRKTYARDTDFDVFGL
jgi:hypothetical protein